MAERHPAKADMTQSLVVIFPNAVFSTLQAPPVFFASRFRRAQISS